MITNDRLAEHKNFRAQLVYLSEITDKKTGAQKNFKGIP